MLHPDIKFGVRSEIDSISQFFLEAKYGINFFYRIGSQRIISAV